MKLTNHLLLVVTFLIFAVSCQEGLQQPLHLYTLNNPADTGSRFPNFYQDNEGTIYMSWLMHIDEDIYAQQYAKYNDEGWTEARGIKVGTDFFANWADFPSVVGMNGEAVAAHWLKKIEGGPYAYNVEIAFPDTATGRWEQIITPHLDGTATEHGFVSMEPLAEDRVLAIWLDGRNTEGRGHDEYADSDKAMMLRSAEVTRDGDIIRKNIIDPMVCDCCQTDLVAVDDGYVAVYRGRTEGEIRDILISRYDMHTGEWSTPVAVHDDNWEIQACPVNGPRVAAVGNNVAVAWYTGANEEPRVLLARSTDGGQTFQEPITVAEENTAGRVDLLLTEEGPVFVSWLQTEGQTGYVMFREVLPDGSLSEALNVGITSSSRLSGFPRIEKTGNSIILAWTQTEPLVRVRTARVDVR